MDALGKIAIADSSAINSLSQMLSDAQEPLLRCHVASTLLKIDAGSERAIAVLSEILETVPLERELPQPVPPDHHKQKALREYLLWRTADSLGRDNSNCQSASDVLFQLAQTCISTTPCLPVLYSLSAIDRTVAIRALIQLMESRPNSFLFEALAFFCSVDVGNELVIDALVRLIHSSDYQSNVFSAAGSLGVVDPFNSLAIETLIELLESEDNSPWSVARELGNMGINDLSLPALIKFVQVFQKAGDWRDRKRLTDCFKDLTLRQRMIVVQELKGFLSPKSAESAEEDQFDSGAADLWDDLEGVRAEVCYQIIWHCAAKMSYPDFYRAWAGKESLT